MKNYTCNRRQLLRSTLLSVAALPFTGHSLLSTPALAQDIPEKLSEDDVGAKALGYLHDSTKIDKTNNPGHQPSQICNNCSLSIGPEGEWRGCALFPGKTINSKGWCKAWSARSS